MEELSEKQLEEFLYSTESFIGKTDAEYMYMKRRRLSFDVYFSFKIANNLMEQKIELFFEPEMIKGCVVCFIIFPS